MDRETFDRFREIVYHQSGISLGKGKESLVCARLRKRMRTLGIDDHRDYLRHLEADTTGTETVHLLDVISTNVTSFFRESAHFDVVREVLNKALDEGQTRFRFWSAASSTGEEPLSLAMTIHDTLAGRSADWRILATDISTRVLEHCQRGIYTDERARTIPPALRARYFKAVPGDPGLFAADPELLRHILYRRLNLSTPPFPMRGPLDIVFCRNVMIYFDNVVRTRLLADIHRLLRPGGLLFVGHAESLTGIVSEFEPVRPSVYRKSR